MAKFVFLIHDIKYLHLFSVYGYSFSSFIFMSILYVLPLQTTHVVSACLAGILSLTFIFKELRQLIEERMRMDKRKFLGVSIYLVASHLYFIYRLTYLFK